MHADQSQTIGFIDCACAVLASSKFIAVVIWFIVSSFVIKPKSGVGVLFEETGKLLSFKVADYVHRSTKSAFLTDARPKTSQRRSIFSQ